MRFAALILTVVLIASASPFAQSVSRRQTTASIQEELERLPVYGVFDFLSFGVDRGKVTLTGYSYNGGLKSQAARAVKRIAGVDEVANKIVDLPASSFDDRIRWATFYRIYGDEFLSRYAPGGFTAVYDAVYQSRRFPGLQPFGVYPIHIVVRNGHTTLYGTVDSAMDKRLAELRAREVGGVFSVDNKLVVDED
jgi:hyperosmotically inducible protein